MGDANLRHGNFQVALKYFAEAVRLQPGEGTYHLKMACAAWRGDELALVEPHFLAAVSLRPADPSIHEMMASWYVQMGQMGQALNHSSCAMKLQPEQISYTVTHADVLCVDGQVSASWDLIRPLVAAGQGGPWLARVYAKLASRIGREADAVATIDRELAKPDVSTVEQARLHYAAAGLLDGMGQFDQAFEHARQANIAGRQPFDPDAHSRFVSGQIAFYTRRQLKSLPRATHGNARPLLIVGMTRSGTSLVEQILASHPAVFGGGELSYLSEAAFAAGTSDWSQGDQFPGCWNHLSVNRANQLAERYLSRITAMNSTATYLTDKMPQNFLFLGTAELLLPDCRVIHCIRDPRDTCLSCYFTDFASGKNFSFDPGHLARYYRDYLRLMEHWKKVLKLPILDVHYEEVVSDQASQTRRILEFLNLPWDEKCQQFHENKRHVATASREQVRRPVYSTSVGRWRHYEKHIPELMTLAGK
ncbi:MAG TPA: sulfotransferase [Tepidisphaeraceae bacterium]|nr:sulfotransferase [Tepidisphaeraceae bacterium]